ncbi:hypothetical protein [Aquabacterium sp. OR-4]|uniref:hypothetical protein n=1 Tax=Aquabacterium sp. OR-4 TaxID=2978127 RepID=UPI0028C72A98|nr:hypothetical protein [Aquabacterium sp. OR-4]MDT7834922.1 hypothetical protein [Aquabacterium sp. OR-4]
MSAPLPWHDEAELLGVQVRVHFFDPAEVDARSDAVARLLPVLVADGRPALAPLPLVAPGQRPTCRAGGLVAQPDALWRHGDGLLCLTHHAADRSGDGGNDARRLDPVHWRSQLRMDLLLQAVATAMAVAGQHQLPTLALWRGSNVLAQFDPGSAVLECMASLVGAARLYWNAPGGVTPAQLASFCEPRLRALPGLAEHAPMPLRA